MYVRTYDINPNEETDVIFDDAIECESIQYWRKHHNLHDWMEKLYREKGGKEESFNCVNVRLNNEDLDRLEKDLVKNNLPKGFLSDSKSLAVDLQFISKARTAIELGKSVFYSSWW